MKKNRTTDRRTYLLILLAVSLVEMLTHWGVYDIDAVHLYNMREAFLGERPFSSIKPLFLVRPLLPFLASLLPFDANTSFAFINAILWPALVYVFFCFSEGLLDDSRSAFYSAFLLSCAIPLLLKGVATDLAGYLFSAVLCFMVVRYDKSQSLRSSLLIGVVIGIGALAREIVFMFLPFLVLYELTKEKRSIAKILLVIAVSVIPAIIWCYFIGSNYISNFVDNLSHYGGTADSTFGALLTSVFYAFPLSMFILPGFMEENDRKKLRFHYSYLATAAFFVVAWTYYHYRLTFILFPSVLPLTVKGLRWFANKTSEKPILRRIKPAHWELIMLIMYIAFTNHYGLRYVSLPGGPGVRT